MKKLILLLTLPFLILSCSKSDDNGDDLPVTINNFLGIWYYKETIMPDGTVIPYAHLCSTHKDYLNFSTWGTVDKFTYSPECDDIPNTNNDYYFWPDEEKITTLGVIPTSYVVKLTNTEMHLQYEHSLAVGQETIDIYTRN